MSKSLQGRTILITRSRRQAPQFRELLEKAGAVVLEIPTIEIRPRLGPNLDSAIKELPRYDWLIFTSSNGAEIFLERVSQREVPHEARSEEPFPKICAIGPATQHKVEEYGHPVDLVPQVYQAEGVLLDLLGFHQGDLAGLRILLPRASRARGLLPDELRRHGAQVEVLPVYDTIVPERSRRALRDALEKGSPDLITFTSSSTVHHLLALGNLAELKRFRYAAIGPITAATAKGYGLNVALQAKPFTIPDLVSAIEGYFARQSG